MMYVLLFIGSFCMGYWFDELWAAAKAHNPFKNVGF